MPFNMDFTKIKDFEELHADGWEHNISQAIGWLTLAIGVNRISIGNSTETARRIRVHQSTTDSPILFTGAGDEYLITYQDVVRRAGLTTNAGAKTRDKFKKDVIDSLWNDAAMEIEKEILAIADANDKKEEEALDNA